MAAQQDFLRAEMSELGLTREAFALRLACTKRTFDKWLLPATSNGHRNVDESMWKFVREVLGHERLKVSLAASKKSSHEIFIYTH